MDKQNRTIIEFLFGSTVISNFRISNFLKPEIIDAASAFFIRILSAGLAYFLFVFVARVSSLHEYESFAFAFTLVGFLGPLASLGGAAVAFKHLSHIIHDKSDPSRLEKANYMIFSTLVGSILFSLIAFGALWFQDIANHNVLKLLLISVLILFSGLTEVLFAFNRMMIDTKVSLIYKEIVWRVFFITVVYLLSYFHAVSTINLISTLALSYFAMVSGMAWRVRHIILESMSTKFKWKVIHPKEVFVYMSLSVAGMAFVHIDNLIVGSIMPQNSLGVFFSSQRVTQVIYFFSQSIGVFAGAAVTIAFRNGSFDHITKMSRLSGLVAGFFALLTALVIALFSSEILSLFRPEFASQSGILVLLLIGPVVYAFGGYHSIIPSYCGGEEVYLKVRVYIALLFVVLKVLIAKFSDIYVYSLMVSLEACVLTLAGIWISNSKCKIRCF